MVLLPITLQAQHLNNPSKQGKALIQKQGLNQLQLPAQALQRIQKFSKNSIHKAVHAVQLPEKLYEIEKLILYVNPNSKRIHFTPGKGAEEIQIIKTSIEVPSDKRYIWVGDVFHQSSEHPIGSATFVQNNDGEINGNIDVEGIFFQIHPLGKSGMHAFIEFDREEINRKNKARAGRGSPNQSGSGTITTTSDIAANVLSERETTSNAAPFTVETSEDLLANESEIQTSCSMRYIRALVLYTEGAAESQNGNIDNVIDLAIAETNQAYANSGINNVRLVVQHIQEDDFNESEGLIQTALYQRLIPDDKIFQLRDSVKADVVIMFTSPGIYYDDRVSGPCDETQCPSDPGAPDNREQYGIAGGTNLEADSAYVIVDISKATAPKYTLAHEIGHIQAAQHHPSDDTHPFPLYDYGYGHRFSYPCGFLNRRRCYKATIMAYDFDQTDNDITNIKYYSTPYTTYNGKALGIVNERDNRRVLNNTRVTVSNFKNANEPAAGISYAAGTSSQYGQNYTFSDNTCGGTGTFSYQWQKSSGSPTNFGSVQSTSSSWFVTLSPGTWYIKLTVSTSTGQSSSKVVSVNVDDNTNQPCPPGQICENPGGPQPKLVGSGTDESEMPETTVLLPAYPNPFNPSTQITFDLPEAEHVSIMVYDMSGRELTQLTNRNYQAGRHQVTFDASTFSSGNYLVRLQAGNKVQTQTITLIK